jgi:nitrous oxide reductase accessory protein NosL
MRKTLAAATAAGILLAGCSAMGTGGQGPPAQVSPAT